MPFTVNRYLNIPNDGDLSGTWGSAAVNPNMSSLDGLLGGFVTLSLSSATTFVLGLPSGAATGLTPGAGPSQSENALIKFSGTLSGNAVVQFTMPGFYIIHNACTVSTFYVQLSPASGTGNSIGAPPGRKCHVFFDGTDMDYVDLPEVGAFMDLAVSTTPAWMTACSVLPWLICDGATYSSSVYPILGVQLGSTFGGNGITTFGVPDLQNRVRVALATAGALRLNSGTSGIAGATWGAAGGDERISAHSHTTSVTDPGHVHPLAAASATTVGGTNFNFNKWGNGSGLNTNSATTNISVSVATTGGGASQNVQPTLIHGVTFIKT